MNVEKSTDRYLLNPHTLPTKYYGKLESMARPPKHFDGGEEAHKHHLWLRPLLGTTRLKATAVQVAPIEPRSSALCGNAKTRGGSSWHKRVTKGDPQFVACIPSMLPYS